MGVQSWKGVSLGWTARQKRKYPQGLVQACPGSRHQKPAQTSQDPGRRGVQMVALGKVVAVWVPPEPGVAAEMREVSSRLLV